jgi:hypothetical protein
MRVILEFNMPEESEDYTVAMRGWKYRRVIEDFDNWLRSKIKYEDVETMDLQVLRDKFNEIKIDILAEDD